MGLDLATHQLINMENMEMEKIGKLGFWNALTLIVLYFVAKKNSETKRLLGWAVFVRILLPALLSVFLFTILSL